MPLTFDAHFSIDKLLQFAWQKVLITSGNCRSRITCKVVIDHGLGTGIFLLLFLAAYIHLRTSPCIWMMMQHGHSTNPALSCNNTGLKLLIQDNLSLISSNILTQWNTAQLSIWGHNSHKCTMRWCSIWEPKASGGRLVMSLYRALGLQQEGVRG